MEKGFKNKMKKILIVFAIIIALPIGFWLISPLFIEKKVSESLENIMPSSSSEEKPQVVAFGNFSGLDGHQAEGKASLLKIGESLYVRFENDFKITNGPDLFVYLGKDGRYSPETQIASLKGNIGSQNYEIPKSIDVNNYNEVWVWCRAFAVPFGKAVLK